MDTKYTKYDIIDVGQTINGCSTFIIMDEETLDVRYIHNISLKYEYDVLDLLNIEQLRVLGNGKTNMPSMSPTISEDIETYISRSESIDQIMNEL